MKKLLLCLCLLGTLLPLAAQRRYVNPVLHLDYSDPDVCRVGDDYYMTASSFNCLPGLPVLHSRDLVRWTLVGAALEAPVGALSGAAGALSDVAAVQHGKGVWAPSLRYHDGWFYIFWGDPDAGIFRVRTQDPAGRWEAPVRVYEGVGYIDPCPLWDEDGRAWLSMACAGSRAGVKSVVLVAEMAPDATKLLEAPRIVFDGHASQPTIEGTKFYKRSGAYYIFAPAGGVSTGWQTVLRSSDGPYGPYRERIVLASAEGTVNGPHQGSWVETPFGEHWFLHFQDKGAYGRIVHLQPMAWQEDGWPVIGDDPDGDGVGQPVEGGFAPRFTPGPSPLAYRPYGLDPDWQFPSVPSPRWSCALPDGVRLFAARQPSGAVNLWDAPNLMLQKFPAEKFRVTAALTFRPRRPGERAGLVVMGEDYAGLTLDEKGRLSYVVCRDASSGSVEACREVAALPVQKHPARYPFASADMPPVKYPDVVEIPIWVRLDVAPHFTEGPVPEAVCRFSYSLDGKSFEQLPEEFTAREGRWIGAKWGFFCNASNASNDAGSLDVLDVDVNLMPGRNRGQYDENQVPDYELPDVLGGVRTARQWERRRRPEVLHLLENEMFGTSPAAPAVRSRLVSEDPSALSGAATRREVDLLLNAEGSRKIRLLMYIPNARVGKVPAFLGLNFHGNHTTTFDPGVSLPDYDRYGPGLPRHERGFQADYWAFEECVRRGYAVVTFFDADVDPDYDGGAAYGVRADYPSCTWGSISTWAWGLSRALEYLETDPSVDGSRVAVVGHSRLGKAALWAGACDPRFAVVISNGSGCGGAALSRRCYGETLKQINDRFPHWFCERFKTYNDRERTLPFDQHFLLALTAPRPLYVGSGSEDLWADPYGEYLSLCAVAPVYGLYGLDGFTDAAPRAVEVPEIHDHCGYHLHRGRHAITLYDWQRYLDFADRFLK